MAEIQRIQILLINGIHGVYLMPVRATIISYPRLVTVHLMHLMFQERKPITAQISEYTDLTAVTIRSLNSERTATVHIRFLQRFQTGNLLLKLKTEVLNTVQMFRNGKLTVQTVRTGF